MPHRILLNLLDVKMAIGSSVAFLSMLADAVSESPAASWESIGLKGALILAIIYLVRELAKQRAECAAEASKREERFAAIVDANTLAKEQNTHALQELKAATDVQTGYYKTVAQTLLNREIKPHLPKED